MKRFLLFPFTVVLLLAACGGPAAPTPTAPLPEATAPFPAATPADQTGYPAPTQPALPESYPAAPESAPTLPAGYPGGEVWVVRPAGLQCESPGPYADLKAAVAALEEAGVAVLQPETINLAVCSACGCPTSEHFRVKIDPAGLATALALGWQQE
ncbi:MAG: hypothetical protein AB1791_01730 [Chloroflexota bacterium]